MQVMRTLRRGLASRRLPSLALLLLATLARLWGLGSPSLWYDEAFSHFFSTLPQEQAWTAMIVDAVHPPFYYLLLRPWLHWAGQSEFALRFPSALFGVLTVALAIRAGTRWLDQRAARWAGLLLAVNPFHVWYSGEARMYAMLGALTLVVLLAFWEALHRPRTLSWVTLVIASAIAYTTHYFALYLPLIQFVHLLLTFRRNHGVLARWTGAQAAAAIPLAIWLTVLYTRGGGSFGIGWIPHPRPVDLLKTLWALGMAYDGQVTTLVEICVSTWAGLLILGVRHARAKLGFKGLLLLSFLVPILVTFFLSLRRPTYVDRFFIGALPPLALLAATGLTYLRPSARLAAGLVLVGLGAWGVVRFHADPLFTRENWREAAAYVEAHEENGDGLALRYLQYSIPFGYYYDGDVEPVSITTNQETKPLGRVARGLDRLWLVYRHQHKDSHELARSQPFDLQRDETDDVVLEWMSSHTPSEQVSFAGVTVMLFPIGGGS